jgi:hypothetical protein
MAVVNARKEKWSMTMGSGQKKTRHKICSTSATVTVSASNVPAEMVREANEIVKARPGQFRSFSHFVTEALKAQINGCRLGTV